MKALSSSVIALGVSLFVFAGIAAAQPAVEEIRRRALVAIDTNQGKYSDLLFRSKYWLDISGRQPEIHTSALLSHLELVGHNPALVLDRWEDQPSFEAQYAMSQRVVRSGSSFGYGANEYAKELLNGAHPIELIGMKTDRAHRAYVLLARPSQSPLPSATALAKCAANMRATLTVESDTFFPVRLDVEVVNDQQCSTNDVGSKIGTQMRFHSIRLSGQDRCGELHEIYALDQRVNTSPLVDVGAVVAFPGSIAERSFRWGPTLNQPGSFPRISRTGQGYSKITSTTVSSDFQVFLTGSCIQFEGAAPQSLPSHPSVDFVQKDSYFDLDDTSTASPGRSHRASGGYSLSAIAGLYVRKGGSTDYIAFAPDGTFLLRQAGKNYSGNYRIQSDTITVQGQNVLLTAFRITDNSIVEPNGTVWTKQ
jgi:hypothetical protein